MYCKSLKYFKINDNDAVKPRNVFLSTPLFFLRCRSGRNEGMYYLDFDNTENMIFKGCQIINSALMVYLHWSFKAEYKNIVMTLFWIKTEISPIKKL